MKEANSSPFTPMHRHNAAGAAARSPTEKHTPPPWPALRVKPPSSSVSLSSSPSSLNSASSSSSSMDSPFMPNSPFRSSSVIIPFSWEQQPGIPKTSSISASGCGNRNGRSCDRTLPLPPLLRSNSEPFVSVPRKKRSELEFVRDPFAVALIECSKEDQDRQIAAAEEEVFWKGTTAKAGRRREAAMGGGRRRTVSDRFGFVDLYASCKTTCSVVESTVYVPRSGRGVAAYGLLSRRTG